MIPATIAFASAMLAQQPALRVAAYPPVNWETTRLDGRFLERARANGYSHVMCPFGQLAPLTRDDPGHAFNKLSLRSEVRSALAALRDSGAGLGLIPYIQTGSGLTGNWWYWVGLDLNPKAALDSNADASSKYICHPWVPKSFHPQGAAMDRAFRAVLRVFAEEFRAAGQPLEYINLSQSESFARVGGEHHLLIGWGGPGGHGAAADRAYIRDRLSRGDSPDLAFRKIFAAQLLDRARAVDSILGKQVGIILDGDMWDPQYNGGGIPVPLRTFLGNGKVSVVLATRGKDGLAALPGLAQADRDFLAGKLIVMPWIQLDTWAGTPWPHLPAYAPESTFAVLARHGLRLMHSVVVTEGENNCLRNGSATPLSAQLLRLGRRFAQAAERFPAHLGVTAYMWSDAYREEWPCTWSLEFAAGRFDIAPPLRAEAAASAPP